MEDTTQKPKPTNISMDTNHQLKLSMDINCNLKLNFIRGRLGNPKLLSNNSKVTKLLKSYTIADIMEAIEPGFKPIFIAYYGKKVCNICNEHGLHWNKSDSEVTNIWRLFEQNGYPHICKKNNSPATGTTLTDVNTELKKRQSLEKKEYVHNIEIKLKTDPSTVACDENEDEDENECII